MAIVKGQPGDLENNLWKYCGMKNEKIQEIENKRYGVKRYKG